jgi:hypothetical protein
MPESYLHAFRCAGSSKAAASHHFSVTKVIVAYLKLSTTDMAFTVITEPVLVTHGIERREVPLNVPAVDPAAAQEIADEQAQRPAANIDHRADILVSDMLSNLSWFVDVSIVHPSTRRFPTAHKVTHVLVKGQEMEPEDQETDRATFYRGPAWK